MANYKLSDKVQATEILVKNDETGIFSKKQVKAIFPFGHGHGYTDKDNLTDETAEWLLSKKEYQAGGKFDGYIIKSK